MKGKRTRFLQGFGIVTAIGLLGLALSLSLVPATVSADVVCSTASQPGVGGTAIDSSSSCFVPSGVTVTGATLEYTLDDGGDISINGQQVLSIAPNVGIDSGSKNLSASLFTPGQSFILKVRARNALDPNTGETIGDVYGEATVRVETSDIQDNPPSVDLTADDTFISAGDSTTLRWTTDGNPTSCVASGAWSGSKNPNGGSESTGSLFSTRTYTITCSNSSGSDSDSVTVVVQNDPPPTCQDPNANNYGGPLPCRYDEFPNVDLTADDTSLNSGESTILRWTTDGNPTSCVASGAWSGSKNVNGGSQSTGPLTSTRTYTITCSNSRGSDSDSVTVVVTSQPIVSVDLTADDTSIDFGDSTILRWTTDGNPTSCTASGGWSGSKNVNGGSQSTGALTNTRTFTITCSNSNSSDSDSVTVTVGPQSEVVSVDLTADETSLNSGESTTLRWTTDGNPTSCTASGGWSGSKNTAGGSQSTGSLTSTRTFTITCSNSNSSDSDSVTVTVDDDGDLPNVDLTATDTSINSGDTTTLVWTTSGNPDTCTASGAWSGNVSPSGGSQGVGPLFSNRTYTITCSNENGSDTDSVTITVGTTPGQGPDVTTRNATNIDRDQATLNGDVDGNGLSTEVWFEYSDDRDEVEDCDTDNDCERTSRISTGTGNRDFDDETDDDLRENTRYYFRAVARNSAGTDYGSILSFTTDDDEDDRICNDRNATNYGSSGTCRYPDRVCQDPSALNYRGTLPCRYVTVNEQRPTVILYADQTSISYNSATFIRWSTVNATSCQASGGSVGWAGTKSIGPGSFYTGSLSSSRTYTLTCSNNSGSDTDSVTISVRQPTTGGPRPTPPPPASSLVLVTSSIDRNQPILPTLDNTRPRPGDEITYTVNYQNIGTGAITNLVLRLDLPYEVVYLYSTPPNPIISGNTLIFNLGTLQANGSGTVTVRVRVRENAPPGALLNFPAVLSYIDPAGFPQTVTANVSAQVWNMQPQIIQQDNANVLGAAAFLSGGFWPTTLFGWLLLIILILLLVLLARYLMGEGQPFERRTTTTTIQH